MQDYLIDINRAVKLIDEADCIVLGAGAGLSASGGLDYADKKLFEGWFPRLVEHGIENIGEAISTYWKVHDSNRRNFWAYWANHIKKIRYETPVLKPYLDLFELLKSRNYFIITTNVDGQFIKAGFDEKRIFTPQGDYGLFQCDKPCCDELYENKMMIDKMIENMEVDNFIISENDIPRCPKCGSYMSKNLRVDDTFVELPHMIKHKEYVNFINNSTDKKLLLIELGVGFNTPAIIRWPFDRITKNHPNAELIRINMDYPEVPSEILDKSISFSNDIMQTIKDIKQVNERLK